MEEREPPTEEEWENWLSLPTTRKYRKFLNQWRESLKEQWAKGQFTSQDREEMVTANFQALAEVQVLNRLANLDYEEFLTTFEEE